MAVYLVWLSYSFYIKKPQLLFELSEDKCPKIVFYIHYTWGPEVVIYCEERGIESDYVFATRGVRAVCFKSDRGIYRLEFEKAEKGKIYFYKYHKRFKNFVEEI